MLLVQIQLLRTKRGVWTAKIKLQSGRWILLHSAVDPMKEAASSVPKIEGAVEVVMLGLGLGFWLLQLHKCTSTQRIHVVERYKQLFLLAQQNIKEILLDERVRIYVGEELESLKKKLSKIKRPYIILHKPSIKLAPRYYHSIMKQFYGGLCDVKD